MIRDPKTPTKLASFYALKFARFHAKVRVDADTGISRECLQIRGDRKLAEKIVKDALTRDMVTRKY